LLRNNHTIRERDSHAAPHMSHYKDSLQRLLKYIIHSNHFSSIVPWPGS
jgi:hypothetical protein